MKTFLQEVRIALRTLMRAPLVTVVAVLSLGIGVAAKSTMFAAVDVFMLRPLPYADADRLVRLWSTNEERGWQGMSTSLPDALEWREQSRTMDVAPFATVSFNVAGAGELPERVEGIRTSANFDDVLAIQVQRGRMFRSDEELAGADQVALISDRYWQSRFAGSPDAVGAVVSLDGVPHTIIGVLPPGLDFPTTRVDLWIPLGIEGTEERTTRYWQNLTRLRPGATLARANTELQSIARRQQERYPATNAAIGAEVRTLREMLISPQVRTGSTIVMGAVLFVLLIACANIANLLLARAAAREREIALRAVLGAGRLRLARQLLLESLLLAAAGGALGLLLSVWGVRGLVAMFPAWFPRVHEIALDARIVLFTLAVTMLSGLAFGMAPALRAARADLNSTLREGSGRGTTAGGRRGRVRGALVVAEVALALALLVCAGLLVRGYLGVRGVDLGFRSDALTMRLTLPVTSHPDSAQVIGFHETMLDRLGALPGVAAVGATTVLPFQGGSSTYYDIAASPVPDTTRRPIAQFRAVLPGYFEAMGIPVRRGRGLTRDDHRSTAPVMVVNETFARTNFPDRDAIGERLVFASGEREIVGIVGDTHDFGGEDEAPGIMYLNALQREYRSLSFVIQPATGDAATLAPLVRAEVQALDPTLPLYSVQSMAAVVEEQTKADFILAKLLAIFAGVALLMAVLGVYGVMAYGVTQRTQEVGIRMALGAQPGDIMTMMVRQGSRLALLGIALGLLLASACARVLSFFLFGVSPFDVPTFAAVTVALATASLVACWLPTRRATRIDPLIALRSE